LIPRRRSLPWIAAEGVLLTVTLWVISAIFLISDFPVTGAVFAVVAACVALFFRDPERMISAKPGQILSPADGTIVAVDRWREERYLDEETVRVCIFMSIFNVHINRIPVDGKVLEVKHVKGGFAMAHLDEASLENERTEIVMTDEKGRRSLMVQVAGLVARRIICRLQPGDMVRTGERFGLICFGSRVDLYLPAETVPSVDVGDKVRAGISVLGSLN